MASSNEIRERVERADTERSTLRRTTALRVGDLFQRLEKLTSEVEQVQAELSEVLTKSESVISLPELSTFTDIPLDKLTERAAAGKPKRGRKKRTTQAKPRTTVKEQQPAAELPKPVPIHPQLAPVAAR